MESAVDGKQSVIVNESFVNEAGWGSSSGNDPIGQIINYADQQLVVVGVAKDYHFRSLKEKIGPLLFKKGSGDLWVKIKPGQAPHALKTIQNAYKRIIPFRPFDYDFMNTINEQNYEAEEKWKQMITVGAALSIFIAGMGMFALMMLSVQRRGKEIGIRKVLGAAVSNIVVLLSMDFLKLVLIAFLLAIPVGYYAVQQWLEGFAYRIHLEWWYFIGAGLMAMMVAWSTIGLQTVKAARVNPTQYLKDE
jgi:ABC-type antimicrobial peptide transport system permease subunit